MVDPERHRRLEYLFYQAMETPPERRTEFLNEACSDDLALRADLEALIAAQSGGHAVASAATPAGQFGPPALEDDAITDGRLLESLRAATLGEYEIIAVLGRGGMATVFLAHDLALDRKVAIKVLHPALEASDEAVMRFQREARTVASLDHTNIIPIYAVKRSHRVFFYVMKFVPGRSLDSIIQREAPLDTQIVRVVLCQVGEALAYAHRRGVMHRDIKPGNIMIDEEGAAVVTDFGVAKLEGSADLTVSGATVGTPIYMSPEQCFGRRVTNSTDQYSLGIVAYEMLTGERPFHGPSALAVMYQRWLHEPTPIAKLRSDCPADLTAAVTRMLQKDSEARWPSLEDMVTAIGNIRIESDDPTRVQMVEMAKAGAGPKLLSEISTPRSPTPTLEYALARPGPHQATTVDEHASTLKGSRVRLRFLSMLVIAVVALVMDRLLPQMTRQLLFSRTDPAPAPARVTIVRAPSDGIVTIDNRVRGRGRTFVVSPGVHQIRITAEGFAPMEVTIDALAGTLMHVPFTGQLLPDAPELSTESSPPTTSRTVPAPETAESDQTDVASQPTVGYLTIDAVPYGMVAINGVDIGVTPIGRHELEPGRYEITITRDGYRTAIDTLTITTGNEERRRVTLIRNQSIYEWSLR